MDLLADVSPADIGAWLMSAAAIVGLVVGILAGINQWNKIIAPPKPGDEFVTAAQIARIEEASKNELDRVEKRLKDEIIRVDQEQTKRTTDLDMYWRSQFHEIRDKLQEMMSKVAAMPAEMYRVVGEVARPIHNRLEKGAILIAQIATKLKVNSSDFLVDDDKGKS